MKRIVALGLVLVVLVVLTGMSSAAMHADQQGKWDWYIQGVGFVKHATIHEKSKVTKSVYVATGNGTIASLRSRSAGEIKWRKVFAETEDFVCIASGAEVVVAASASGFVVAIEAGIGMVSWTAQVPLTQPSRVVSCTLVGAKASSAKVRVVVAEAGSSTVSVISVMSESLSKAAVVSFDQPVGGVACGDNWCWATTADGKIAVFAAEGAAAPIKTGVSGVVRSVSGSFAAILGAEGTSAQLLQIVSGKVSTKQTVNVDKASDVDVHVAVDEDAAEGALLISRPTSNGGAIITIEGGQSINIEVNELRGLAPVVLAARGGKKPEVLLRTSDAHLHHIYGDKIAWTRNEGLSTVQFVKFGELPDLVGSTSDRFGFNELIFLQSKNGRLYAMETQAQGKVRWSTNVFAAVADAVPSVDVKTLLDGKMLQLLAEGNVVVVTLKASDGSGYIVTVEGITGVVLGTSTFSNLARAAGHMLLDTSLRASVSPKTSFYMHEVDASTGVVRGYTVPAGGNKAEQTWQIRTGFPITATADGRNSLAVSSIEALRVVPNATTKVGNVRRKYPTHNMLVVAGLSDDEVAAGEYPSLEILAIDTVSGSVLAHGSVPNVDGPVRMLLVENVLLFHFLDVKKVRYNLGVWEFYEADRYPTTEATTATPGQVISSFFTSGKRSFSSLAANPPQVVSQTLAFQMPEIRTLGVTTSFYGIARKQVLFGAANGRVAALPLNSLLIGGQPNPKKVGEQLSYVMIPSVFIVTHNNLVANIRTIASTPTQLESSSHTVTVGQDIFYIRLSSGKAFDLLNDDFNFNLLLIICGVFAGASLVFQALARRSQLKLMWS